VITDDDLKRRGMSNISQHEAASPGEADNLQDRRGFLHMSLNMGVTAALVASYGTFFGFAVRFLYPAHPMRKQWVFLAVAESITLGGNLSWTTPSGAKVAVARVGEALDVKSFVALSSICPHLGCQVQWQGQNQRFFCPCHNGVFDSMGKGIEGPPRGMSLKRYPLKLEGPILYIEVPVDKMPNGEDGLTALRGVPPAGLRWRGGFNAEVRS
jgi:Rieske Fe-S protein